MAYNAQKTGQITRLGETTSTPETHELDDSGEIPCGQPVRPWRGNTMLLTSQGPASLLASIRPHHVPLTTPDS